MRTPTMNSNVLNAIGDQLGYLRPYTKASENHAKTYVKVNYGNGYREIEAKNTGLPFLQNVTGLPTDSWKAIDDDVLKAIDDAYCPAWNDVVSRGLTKSVSEYSKLFTSRKMGDTEDAVKDMDGVSNRKADTATFDVDTLPLFVTHKDFEISWRNKGAFGAGVYDKGSIGIDWDSSMMEEGIKNIMRMNENVLFNGWDVPYGGSYVYGYQDFTSRNQTSLTYDWSSSSTTSAQILADVKEMWQDATIDSFQPMSGFILYVHPSAYGRFVDDYTDYYVKTLRDRVLDLPGIEDIKISSYLDSVNDAVLVRMDSASVRVIQGTNGIVPVMWYDNAGMMDKLTLLSIQEPQLRADANGYTSVTHGNYTAG